MAAQDRWFETEPDSQLGKMHGRLKSISVIDDKLALIGVQINGIADEPLKLFTVNLADKASSRLVHRPMQSPKTLRLLRKTRSTNKYYWYRRWRTLCGRASSRQGFNRRNLALDQYPQQDESSTPALTALKLIVPKQHRTAVENIVLTAVVKC